ncbi:MAG TPA: hypothetical protein VI216_02195 [Candidatus Acidoferrales bacterium]
MADPIVASSQSGNRSHQERVWIRRRNFRTGLDKHYPEEAPDATGYVMLAERRSGSWR